MTKGKYAHIVDLLPKSLGTDPDQQERVDAIKRQILDTEPDGKEITSEVVEELVGEITAMQQVLNDLLIRAVGKNRTASRYARLFRDVRIMKNSFNEQEKITADLICAYGQLLSDQYEVEGITNLKLDDGGSVRIQYEPHGSVVDKDLNRKWAMENGLENLLSLPWQTINALTKEALLRGESEPEGVEATTRTKVVFTKG